MQLDRRRFSPAIIMIFLNPVRAVDRWFQLHFVLSRQANSQGYRVLWFTFPTAIEAIVVGLFWVLSTVLCCIGYKTFAENI